MTHAVHQLCVRALPLLLATILVGCSSLTVTRINSAQKKPNNVWVFFTVEKGDEPVAGLTAEDFEIYEDSNRVSQFESQQVILNPDVAAVMYTLLLLDMSGSVTESGEADRLVDAATVFSDQVGKTQKVAVYAFDGSEDVRSVVRFTEAKGSIEGGLEGLRTYQAKDPSTNLHGAVIQGLQTLEDALDKDKRPLKFGTLVVFTDGTDRAGRVDRDEMEQEISDERYANIEMFAIGVGAEIERSELKVIGRDGTELAEDQAKVQSAFETVAARIEAHTKRFYLLSYCTPSRKGEHEVKILAKANPNKNGKPRSKGALEYSFVADGFGPPPQCDPQRAPTFRLDKNLVPGEQTSGNKNRSAKVRGSAGFGKQPRTPGGGS